MASGSHIRSLGKLLYTQNPFYLISCFLIIYGIQIAALSGSTLITKSLIMSGSLAAYTFAMAITCVGVVRLGKVWDDARSILLVVVIAQVALSTSLDELCITRWSLGAPLLAAAGLFACLTTEFVLRVCGIQFPSWYRLSFYAMQLVFFGSPIVLGRAVEQRQTELTNWGAPLFSLLIGICLLLLIPAVRRGHAFVRNNGTPWRWPLYPLSLFAILIIMASIRSHAIWMSFGFLGAPVRFEPFLLLPIGLAVLVLLVESEHPYRRRGRTYLAMLVAPLLLLCGIGHDGMTHLPIRSDLQLYFGSAETLSLIAIAAFYSYVWARGERGSEFCVTCTLLALAFFGDVPEVATNVGFQPWMYGGIACVLMLWSCFKNLSGDHLWLGLATIATLTILIAGRDYDRVWESAWMAAGCAVASMLMIGAYFDTEIGAFLRQSAAWLMMLGAIALVGWHITRMPGWITYGSLSALAVSSIAYLRIVRRTGWLYVFAVQMASLLIAVSWAGYESKVIVESSWPIQSGLVCFVIGLSITSVKSGFCQRLRGQLPRRSSRYRPGF
ncbi:MAG: hypothetical protein ACR2NZ_04965 [Rubripirellula sp.]